jgi:TPR repeat protein
MLGFMEKSWYRNLFSRSQNARPEAASPNADSGNAEAQFGLGLKFANGQGVAQDYVQAADWYRKAARQSHPLAQFNLGVMYASGQGVAQDEAQSAVWFGKAAHQGDAGAQFKLGKSCHRASFAAQAQDAPEARIEAYKWYRLAAAQGYQGSAAARTALIFSMTREDVAIGDRRAAAFVATGAKVVET